MPANTKVIFQRNVCGFSELLCSDWGNYYLYRIGFARFKSRTTKDYDMVIIDEVKNKEFYTTLNHFLNWESIKEVRKMRSAAFRFTTTNPEFPSMIELFSILPEYTLKKDGREIPYILTKMLVYQPYYWMKIIIIYWCMKKRNHSGVFGIE